MMTVEEMQCKLTDEELAEVERCVDEYRTALLQGLMGCLLSGAARACDTRRYAMECHLRQNVWEDNNE